PAGGAEVAHVRGRGHPAGVEEGLRRTGGRALAEDVPAGAHRSPSVSASENIRFRFWIACEEVPFQRLSIADSTTTLPVWASAAANTRQKLVSSTSLVPGGVRTTSTNGSRPYASA